MRHAHDVETVRAAERALMTRLPDGALMQRAAAGLAATTARALGRVYGQRVVLLVGSGDNGGDALFAGARLAQRGARVEAALVGSRAHEAGLADFRRAGGRVLPDATAATRALQRADAVLDGIVGIGGRGALRDSAAELVAVIPGTALVVAVDVPSGVDADTGEVEGAAVTADVTVTFGTLKPGLLVDPGAGQAGAVELVDIGLTPHLPPPTVTALQAADVAARLPRLARETDKYRRGVVGIVAGSDTYGGAAVLATGGALRLGTGMVRFVSVKAPADAVRARWPEAVVTTVDPGDRGAILDAGRVQAWVVGPGLGTHLTASGMLHEVLSSDVPVVVDADALTLLADDLPALQRRSAPTVLTPHAGELARLLRAERDDVEAHRLALTRAAAGGFGVTVLLKGSTTVVADPEGNVRVNPTGTSWLATAGSGDVLAGAVGAALAGGLGPLDAASVAAYLHGGAARLAAGGATDGAPIIAEDVIAALPAAIRSLSSPPG